MVAAGIDEQVEGELAAGIGHRAPRIERMIWRDTKIASRSFTMNAGGVYGQEKCFLKRTVHSGNYYTEF
jgi:sigma54-dependent transcription regulator